MKVNDKKGKMPRNKSKPAFKPFMSDLLDKE